MSERIVRPVYETAGVLRGQPCRRKVLQLVLFGPRYVQRISGQLNGRVCRKLQVGARAPYNGRPAIFIDSGVYIRHNADCGRL